MLLFTYFFIAISLMSTLAAPTTPAIKPAATSATVTHSTQPTQSLIANLSPQSSLIKKLNILVSYVYNGLDYLADGQSNLTTGQTKNQMLNKMALDGLKLEQALVKNDLRSFYEVLKWEQKSSFDVIKWTLKTAFENVKLEFDQVVSEQRSLRSDNKAGLDGLQVDTRALQDGHGNLTTALLEQKSEIAELKTQLNDLKTEHKAELNALKNELRAVLNSTHGQQQLQNVAIHTEMQNGFKGLQDLVKAIPWCADRDGWVYFSDRCYKFMYGIKLPRPDTARSECKKIGADIIIVRSKQHNDFFVENMNKHKINSIWIGLRREYGKWIWADGTLIGDRYSNLGNRYGSGDKCVYLNRSDGRWYGAWCRHTSPMYACEKSRDSNV